MRCAGLSQGFAEGQGAGRILVIGDERYVRTLAICAKDSVRV